MTCCLDCSFPKTHEGGEKLARMGFVGCAKKSAAYTRSINSTASCKDFRQGSAEQVETMKKWAERLKT